MDYDKTAIPATYDQGRDHGPAFVKQWTDLVAAHAGEPVTRTVLDLGCGTGRFSQGLASRLDSRVIGIDPSNKMLEQARRNLHRTDVFYACGCAETVPLAANSLDTIFISMAFHHFTNPRQAAAECRRVLRDGGRLCLRTASKERILMYPYVPFFPASRPLLEEHLPPLRFQSEVFEDASFRVVFSGLITQQIANDYAAYAEKLSARADSILLRLDDKDFQAGLEAVRSAKPTGPITEPIDFVVFEKMLCT